MAEQDDHQTRRILPKQAGITTIDHASLGERETHRSTRVHLEEESVTRRDGLEQCGVRIRPGNADHRLDRQPGDIGSHIRVVGKLPFGSLDDTALYDKDTRLRLATSGNVIAR